MLVLYSWYFSISVMELSAITCLWDFPCILMYWQQCHLPFQHIFYHSTGEMYVGGLQARRNTGDRCLTDPGNGDLPVLEKCDIALNKSLNLHWDFSQVGGFLYPLISISSPIIMNLWTLPCKANLFLNNFPLIFRSCRCHCKSCGEDGWVFRGVWF